MKRSMAAYRVLAQVRPLSQASARAVEQTLQGSDLSVPVRAVLEVLHERGPMTVPQVAREFGVTRQSVQVLVDAAVERGLVELTANPQHRRSHLVTVTGHGSRTFVELHRRELENLERVTADLDPDELSRCARVLALLTDRIRQIHDTDQETP